MQLDRVETAFFRNISHEFRTPLSLMLAPIADALNDSAWELPPVHRTRLEIAHRNAVRLLKAVNSLLDFSSIEAGRSQACFEPTELAQFTAELASHFHSLCETAELRLVVDCPALAEPVWVDREMWEKIVLNLLSNAFKFTFDGEIAVTLRPLDGGRVELAVRDTGTGIPAHQIPSLFQRFHTVDRGRGRSLEGSGIGLALVKELTKLHGGTLSVESEIDRGSLFCVRIPFGTAHLPPEQIRRARTTASPAALAGPFVEEASQWLLDGGPVRRAVAEPADHGAPAAGHRSGGSAGRPRIVLAEDNADLRAFVARILADGGCDVAAFPDGDAALAAVRHAAPDLVLTDELMPRLDGFGLLRALRADPATQDLSVLMLSGRAGEQAKIECLTAGADGYLAKPFSTRELLAHVDGAVRLARLRREAAAREYDLRSEIIVERTRGALLESEAQCMALEQQLQQSRKIEALGQFTSGIAHDFNNILTIILASIEMVAEGVADRPRLAADARMIDEAATRGAELTGRLLGFARQQPLQPCPTDANAVVVETARFLQPMIGERIAIDTVLEDGVGWTLIDRTQLSNALVNLAINARDAMPDGGRLTLISASAGGDDRAAPDSRGAPFVMIGVSDTGIGIPAELHDKVCEPFFTTKEVGQGTGLGLSMVRDFVAQSGGHMKIDSEPGRGTTVKLFLPRSSAPARTPAAPPIAVPGGAEKILVVEDDPLVRSQVIEQLTSLGYRTAGAADGTAALAMVDRGAVFDLLFTDLVLPGSLSGWQLAADLSRRGAAARVLYTSGYAADAVLPGVRLEAVPLLTKPYRKADLGRRIREVLAAPAQPR